MFKLFHKKLNKKGFTLAELLVVIAILAILIAIAIPVFSGMVAEANLRVNQANVHSTRSAAVAKILTNLDKKDDSSAGVIINAGVNKEGAGTHNGWIATAEVDNAGNITNLKVFVKTGINVAYDYRDGICTGGLGEGIKATGDTGNFYVMPADVDTSSKFASVKPASGTRKTYNVQVVVTDLDLEGK